eukprot:CAMPEP_0178401424 /NCGR_PEP_ID=MMETSP0689_2-20121128/16295_1 /TAXON_ID=160604 /ORGANISM="Amphidinium massartii, Strain CS-259" /LENGTH=229 /DNA_ID=CAMNT_0020022245 /DNA_START=604 /DNA_END=1290 /DNA_ORIENTATION=-
MTHTVPLSEVPRIECELSVKASDMLMASATNARPTELTLALTLAQVVYALAMEAPLRHSSHSTNAQGRKCCLFCIRPSKTLMYVVSFVTTGGGVAAAAPPVVASSAAAALVLALAAVAASVLALDAVALRALALAKGWASRRTQNQTELEDVHATANRQESLLPPGHLPPNAVLVAASAARARLGVRREAATSIGPPPSLWKLAMLLTADGYVTVSSDVGVLLPLAQKG